MPARWTSPRPPIRSKVCCASHEAAPSDQLDVRMSRSTPTTCIRKPGSPGFFRYCRSQSLRLTIRSSPCDATGSNVETISLSSDCKRGGGRGAADNRGERSRYLYSFIFAVDRKRDDSDENSSYLCNRSCRSLAGFICAKHAQSRHVLRRAGLRKPARRQPDRYRPHDHRQCLERCSLRWPDEFFRHVHERPGLPGQVRQSRLFGSPAGPASCRAGWRRLNYCSVKPVGPWSSGDAKCRSRDPNSWMNHALFTRLSR